MHLSGRHKDIRHEGGGNGFQRANILLNPHLRCTSCECVPRRIPAEPLPDRRSLRIGASVASASGVVAMVLGAIGLYGVIAYLVAGRTREFAIRAALGARSGTLFRHVLATGAWVVAVGVGAGAGLALLATRVAAQAANGLAPADPLVWGSVLLLLVAVCTAAFAGPARRMVMSVAHRRLSSCGLREPRGGGQPGASPAQPR